MKIIFLLVAAILVCFSVSGVSAKPCKYWIAQVDKETETTQTINEKDPKNIVQGIECLLKLEGKKDEGLFSGVTNNQTSQLLPAASVEVCALYYISYLFRGDWEHANGIALVDSNGKFNTDESIDAAYKSYRKWFAKVKEVGLSAARQQNLNPLADSGVKWY